MTYLPSLINIVILESLRAISFFVSVPPTTTNHIQYGPMINDDRAGPHLSVTESGRLLICSM